jgi:hypothetical protein
MPLVFSGYHAGEQICDRLCVSVSSGLRRRRAVTTVRARAMLRTVWQQSQGSWRQHPVFHGLPIREVIVWLRGEDSDV